ncbi:hypothetical protein QCD70_03525 [Agreia sp. PsM10]|uniref:DUF7657 domain-containing protein n=1 Tax=Agreia sp. PsM10 TaxID=3030533 RepID=UPI00263A67B4|nr:hypothetical protein [Agreia sp. PsM10]MDN4639307.1 hypothetical protein [Agreia sp. PsM10]
MTDRPSRYDIMLKSLIRITTPRESGLPSVPVLLAFPILAFVTVAVFVLLGISGSSTGAYWNIFGTGSDPDLLLGTPQLIRSDEWLVQSSWVVSQTEQGFPVFNQTLPGGMDATVQNDLPTWDWSSLFRPHVLGFLFLPLDQGMALRWWIPALMLIISAYVFVVSLLPRRPFSAAFLALTVLFQPIIQWWFLPTTILPVAFAFTGMTAVIWAYRSRSRLARLGWAAATGYVAIAMAMSIYAPFMVPAALALVAFTIGFVLMERRTQGLSWAQTVRTLLPLLAAAVAAAAVMVIWILTRIETIKALFATVYPGQRLQSTGALTFNELISLFSGPFQKPLQSNTFDILGPNSSEAATAMMTSVFLCIPLLWLVWRRYRRSKSVDWLALALVCLQLVVLAFYVIPGWDVIAHVTLLDRSTNGRLRLVFAILAPVAVATIVSRLETEKIRIGWPTTVATGLSVVAASGLVWFALREAGSHIADSRWAVLATILLAMGVVLISRRAAGWGAFALLLATLIVGAQVNPLYRGVFDLAEDTSAGRAVDVIGQTDPEANWVGVGFPAPTAVLLESGVHAYNGVQTYPNDTMWKQIDPSGRFEENWNRLANISWVPGTGAPTVSNPARDQIVVTFDSCSSFAQEHVDFVLSDGEPLNQPCLEPLDEFTQGNSVLRIYAVQPQTPR